MVFYCFLIVYIIHLAIYYSFVSFTLELLFYSIRSTGHYFFIAINNERFRINISSHLSQYYFAMPL